MTKKLVALNAVAWALSILLTARAPAQDKEEKKEAGPSLKVGDKAPGLTATRWLQGSEVKEFEKGKIYVVEFWATWCGPCIVMMPHMAEMQAHYKDQGVTFIGFSAKDANNSEEKVVKFVEKRGPRLKYTFVYADNRKTNEDWMGAAGRNGIPCCFVVDRDGKISYIGHPMYLDLVIPKVASGAWKADADNAAIEVVEKELDAMYRAIAKATGPKGEDKDGDEALKSIVEIETKYPQLMHVPYYLAPKLNVFLKTKKYDQARKRADEVIAHALRLEDATALRTIATTLRGPLAQDSKEIVALSVVAAEAGLKVSGSDDPASFLDVANAHLAVGNTKKVVEYGVKALAAAENDPATFRTIALQLRNALAKGNNDAMVATLKSAEASLKAAGDNSSALAIANVADAHFALGDKEKAVEFGLKALTAAENDPTAFRAVATVLREAIGKGNRELLTTTLSLAESALKIAGNRHAVALLNVADAHFALGNKQKALEFGARAVLAAENEPPALRRSIGLQVQTYEAKRKTSSKDDD